MSHGVLFDLDGTLIDSLADIAAVANAVRADFGLAPLPMDTVRTYVGKGADHLIRRMVPEAPESELPRLTDLYRNKFLTHGLQGQPYPGVLDTLRQLRARRGWKLGIITNKSSKAADLAASHYFPEIAFDVVAGPERVSARKPSGRHILDVLPQLGLTPDRVWFVGDDPVDAQCAESAGVKFFGVTYGIGGVRAAHGQQLATFSELLEKLPKE
jgi:phosphoglycolate phosphatase